MLDCAKIANGTMYKVGGLFLVDFSRAARSEAKYRSQSVKNNTKAFTNDTAHAWTAAALNTITAWLHFVEPHGNPDHCK